MLGYSFGQVVYPVAAFSEADISLADMKRLNSPQSGDPVWCATVRCIMQYELIFCDIALCIEIQYSIVWFGESFGMVWKPVCMDWYGMVLGIVWCIAV